LSSFIDDLPSVVEGMAPSTMKRKREISALRAPPPPPPPPSRGVQEESSRDEDDEEERALSSPPSIMSDGPDDETNEGVGLSLLFAAIQQNDLIFREIDVLCGRGGSINKHSGNIMYRRVVEYNKAVYKRVPKKHRNLVSQSIVQAILNQGGRFLFQPDNNKWEEIPFQRAIQKTSQALRERSMLEGEEEDDDDDDSVEK
jgi:hypothetical protein